MFVPKRYARKDTIGSERKFRVLHFETRIPERRKQKKKISK
jgi:hypothetical protein